MKKTVMFICIGLIALSVAYTQTELSSTTLTNYVWRNVQIVGGGFVSGIEFSPVQQGLIYARTDIGGAYRWNSALQAWVPLTDWVSWTDWNMTGIESIGVDPVDSTRVYLAAGTYTTDSWAGNGVFLRSSDQGNTWLRSSASFKMGGNENGRSMGERLVVDPNMNSTLYFGSRSNGLWRSYNYASTWTQVSGFPSSYPCNVIFDWRSGTPGVTASSTIYVTTAITSGTTLYQSTDYGTTWQGVAGQPLSGFMPHHGVLDSDGTLYLTYGNGPGPNGMTNGAVWKYNTNTGVWTNITPLTPGSFGYAGLSVLTSHPGTVIVSTLDRWYPNDEIYVTTNGGTNWSGVYAQSVRDSSISPYLNWGASSASFGWWMGALQIDPFDFNHVMYGTGATIWACQNFSGATTNQTTNWAVGALGIEENAIGPLISPTAGVHLVSGMGDINGFQHQSLTASPPQGFMINPEMTNESIDYAGANPLFIVRVGEGSGTVNGGWSYDNGTTWSPFAYAPVSGANGGTVAASADGNTIVWIPSSGTAYYSRNTGTSWTACSGIPSGLSIISDRVNPAKFYANNASGGSVYVSTDSGASFTQKATGLPHNGKLSAMLGIEGDLWLAVGSNGIYQSTNSGSSFIKISSVTANIMGFGMASTGRTYPAIYIGGQVGSTIGIFRSDDAATTWVQINDSNHQYGTSGSGPLIGDPTVWGRIYLGSNGRGILFADPVSNGSVYLENWQMMY